MQTLRIEELAALCFDRVLVEGKLHTVRYIECKPIHDQLTRPRNKNAVASTSQARCALSSIWEDWLYNIGM